MNSIKSTTKTSKSSTSTSVGTGESKSTTMPLQARFNLLLDPTTLPEPCGREVLLGIENKLSVEAVAAMKSASSLLTSNKTFTLALTRTATLVSSGAGAMALVTLVYPSQYDQYSSVAALFQFCRIRKTSIQLAMNGGSSTYGTMAVAFDPHLSSGATTSVSNVVRVPGVKIYNVNQTYMGPTIHHSYTYPKSTPWGWLSGAAGSTDPVGSSNGGWCNVALTTISNSASVMQYLITSIFEFRGQV